MKNHSNLSFRKLTLIILTATLFLTITGCAPHSMSSSENSEEAISEKTNHSNLTESEETSAISISTAKSANKELLVLHGENSVLIYGNSQVPLTIDGISSAEYDSYTMDKTKMCLITDVNEDFNGTLWYVDGKQAVQIDTEVKAVDFNQYIALEGNYIYYFTSYDAVDGGTLNRYDCENGKVSIVRDGLWPQVSISPDGLSVMVRHSDAWAGEYNANLPATFEVISLDGDVQTIFDESAVSYNKYLKVAISNDAEYCYFIDQSDEENLKLIVRHNSSTNEIGLWNYSSSIYFNRSLTEVILSGSGVYAYSVEGDKGRSIPVSGNYISPWCDYISIDGHNICDIDSIKEILLDTGDFFLFFDKQYRIQSVNAEAKWFGSSRSDDGKSLAYDTTDRIVYVYRDFLDANLVPEQYQFEETNGILFSEDNKTIFVTGSNSIGIIRIDKDIESVKTDDYVYQMKPAKDGGVYYVTGYEDNVPENDESDPTTVYSDSTESSAYAEETIPYSAISKEGLGGTLWYLSNVPGAKPLKIAGKVFAFSVAEQGVIYYVSYADSNDTFTNKKLCDAFFSREGTDPKSYQNVIHGVEVSSYY